MPPSQVEPKPTLPSDEVLEMARLEVDNADVLTKPALMHDAFDGENREHEMGVWEAAKSHPWACFWAFVMCFTIVSVL